MNECNSERYKGTNNMIYRLYVARVPVGEVKWLRYTGSHRTIVDP